MIVFLDNRALDLRRIYLAELMIITSWMPSSLATLSTFETIRTFSSMIRAEFLLLKSIFPSRAAQCRINPMECSLQTSRNRSSCRISTLSISAMSAIDESTASLFKAVPTTCAPSIESCSTKCEPTNPPAPVTSTRFSFQYARFIIASL